MSKGWTSRVRTLSGDDAPRGGIQASRPIGTATARNFARRGVRATNSVVTHAHSDTAISHPTRAAQRLATIEALVGQLYPAVVLFDSRR
jgi:hypothetical protein